MKPEKLTFLARWVGKIVIYDPDNNLVQPKAVFISGVSKDGRLMGQVLNSTEWFSGSPKYCIDYTPRLMNRLLFIYKRRQAIKTVSNMNKRLVTGKW